MKVLLVNFLRLGDILMMNPIVHSVKERYPRAEIHHLGFREFSMASQVMEHVDHWHFLPRGLAQEASREAMAGVLAAVDLLNEPFVKLNRVGFDLILNLSHTQFSEWAVSLIEAPHKLGARFTDQTRGHYLDVYRRGLGFGNSEVNWAFLKESDKTRKDQGFSPASGRRSYLFQTLSSDPKKAWSEEKWAELFQMIRRSDPFADLKILCAPFEAPLLQAFSEKTDVPLLAADLKQALIAIQKSDVFVTLDTSVKHLANDSKNRVIELALGSSNPAHQGLYRKDGIILSPRTECFPCAHGSSCSRIRRTCAADLSAQDVFNFLNQPKGVSLEIQREAVQSHRET